MGDERDAFVAHFSLARTILFAAGALCFAVLCLLALEVFGPSPFDKKLDSFGVVLAWIVTLSSGACALEFLRRFFSDRPAILIDRHGLYCHRRKQKVPWDYVRAIGVHRQRTPTRLISWEVRILLFDVDPEFDSGMRRLSVWFRDLNFGTMGKSDGITDSDLECHLDDLVAAVRKYAPERLAVTLD